MTGLQDFYEANSFPDPFQKHPPEMFCKKKFLLKICEILQENTCVGVSFKYSCRPLRLQLYKKRLQRRCFPVKFHNTFFEEYLRVTTSGLPLGLPVTFVRTLFSV